MKATTAAQKACRCAWCNENNPLYVAYHDTEWCVPKTDDGELFELLILESFQAGLSWECVLNKREAFRRAFDGFDAEKISRYGEEKIDALMADKAIIRNGRKIRAAVGNAKIFLAIQEEFGSFFAYVRTFAGNTVLYETAQTTSPLSDAISADLIRRGMKFVGSTIVYSYLQAIGVIYSHAESCFLYRNSDLA